MKVICTICSRQKDERPELLPARLRYLAPHIKQTESVAKEKGLPFFILSGKYGLIPADEEIPDYDYYLEESAVDALSRTIGDQIHKAGISEIELCSEGKDSWASYELALKKGADLAGIPFIISRI